MPKKLAERVLAGDVQAAARLMRGLEDEQPSAIKALEIIYAHTGRAYIVGLTGAPGVGKSTLIDALIAALRKKNMTVGVVAVDPTSPFTGGAILGDRVRMQKHSTDKGVFIRSIASRGWRGGLAKAARSFVNVMDAMGKDIIIVETVGSGQSEIDITKISDTSVLVLSPGSGDEMQMMKAGILEAADIFVVNKADKGGADTVILGIELMLGMKTYHSSEWKPSIIVTEAISGKGADELAEAVFRHKEFLMSSGEIEQRRTERAKSELIEAVESFVRNYCYQGIDEGNYLEELVDDIAQRKSHPHSAAVEIINQLSKHLKRLQHSEQERTQ
jgi:LAO/AO transport system kinase